MTVNIVSLVKPHNSASQNEKSQDGMKKGKSVINDNQLCGDDDKRNDLARERAELEADWQDISVGLRKDVGAQLHASWIKPIRPGQLCRRTGTLELVLPSEFTANWVQNRLFDRLLLAWKIARPDVRNLKIIARPNAFLMKDGTSRAALRTVSSASSLSASLPDQNAGDSSGDYLVRQGGQAPMLDSSQTFATFVTGTANVLAFNAAQRMSAEKKPQFCPLYLKAATGQGKTHLLHAIGNAHRQECPGARIYYCSAERFMIDFVQAMRDKTTMEFKSRLRAFDMLLVDDIQFIVGKTATQEELLHTIDALLGAGKRLVIASDRAPQALDDVDQRLLSRLSMGLVADIEPADVELRRSILRNRLAQFAPMEVGDDVIEFLARTVYRNVRELLGGLNKLIAFAQLTGQPVTLALAEAQLTDILSANRKRITIDEIQRTVCQFYRLDRIEMASKRRNRAVVRPRQIAMYLAKMLTPRSYPEIGRKFGGRDHSTVIHAVKLIEDLRVRDADMDSDVRTLLQQLEN